MPDVTGTVTIENARLVFKNFAGREDRYNKEGDRNFSVILPEDIAEAMSADGWNVKRLRPREDEEEVVGSPYIQVSVGYKVRPPRITMIGNTTRRRTELGEDLVEMLDWVDMEMVDLIITPYNWRVPGRNGRPDDTGVKAYLKTMYVTIVEDELDLKYADTPVVED